MSDTGTGRPSVCVVTVTHHPDSAWPDRFVGQAAEAVASVIVDNHSDEEEAEIISKVAARHGTHLVRNKTNLGLAVALNQGAQLAFDEGHRWLLVFDQDSCPLPGIGAELVRLYHLAATRCSTAVVGANFFDEAKQALRFPSLGAARREWVPVRTVIASGSLIEREAYRTIGPFREEFFVDSVDHDYCLRARAKGFQVALATRPLMMHCIGAETTHRVLGRRIATSNHSAARRYDMGRNRTALAREYLFRETRWVLASTLTLLAETFMLQMVEGDGSSKAMAVIFGAWHGLRGKFDFRPAGEDG